MTFEDLYLAAMLLLCSEALWWRLKGVVCGGAVERSAGAVMIPAQEGGFWSTAMEISMDAFFAGGFLDARFGFEALPWLWEE